MRVMGAMRFGRAVRGRGAGAAVRIVMAWAGAAGPAAATELTSVTFGALGDSYTFAYQDRGSRNNHYNWLEQIDGAYAGFDLFGGGGAYNMAESGHTTAHLSGQVDDFGSDLIEPDVFVLFAGVNDFQYAFETAGGDGSLSAAALPGVASAAVGNLQGTVQQILAARAALDAGAAAPKFIVVNTIDRGVWPAVSGDAGNNDMIGPVNAATRALNAELRSWANGEGIPIVDAFSLLNLGDAATTGSLTIAGQSMLPGGEGNNQAANSWYADGAHAGTVFHGLLANVILTAAQVQYGIGSQANLLDLQDEVLRAAYLENPDDLPDGFTDFDAYMASISGDAGVFLRNGEAFTLSYSDYVLIPEPGTLALLGLGLAVMVRRGKRAA